jgi:hypothetical protein
LEDHFEWQEKKKMIPSWSGLNDKALSDEMKKNTAKKNCFL